MGNKYTLSIVILTMNRKEQLLEAINSCLESKMPKEVEFVIVDNCSSDGTKEAVQQLKKKYPKLHIKYCFQNRNCGVGGGRSIAFNLAEGKYLYFLDDDAVISEESKEHFFIDTIKYLDNHKNVDSITTKIRDVVLNFDRDVDKSTRNIDGYNVIFKYLGGSHFLRKSAFSSPLYFDIEYGSEEYAPSIKAQAKGYWHVYKEDVWVVHKPKINKWVTGTDSMKKTLCCGIGVSYATKRILYPRIFVPILWAAYRMRCHKYLHIYEGAYETVRSIVKEVIKKNKTSKISIATVIRLYREFGLTVF